MPIYSVKKDGKQWIQGVANNDGQLMFSECQIVENEKLIVIVGCLKSAGGLLRKDDNNQVIEPSFSPTEVVGVKIKKLPFEWQGKTIEVSSFEKAFIEFWESQSFTYAKTSISLNLVLGSWQTAESLKSYSMIQQVDINLLKDINVDEWLPNINGGNKSGGKSYKSLEELKEERLKLISHAVTLGTNESYVLTPWEVAQTVGQLRTQNGEQFVSDLFSVLRLLIK